VWVDSYYLAKYEARARDFARFMNSGQSRHARQYDPDGRRPHDGATEGCSVRKQQDGSYYLLKPQLDLPATHLSWELANEFAGWMGFRLPSEAEWSRAFRGGDKRIYPWGDEYPDDTFAGFQEGASECDVRPVTANPKGKSPFGIFNMAGNVYEYVADWYNYAYYNQLRDGDRNPLATERRMFPDDEKKYYKTLRGGRWASGPAQLGIWGNRDYQPADEMFRCYGARFALDVDAVRRLLGADGAVAR
jgi:iron(II)-dependent oxidoreductase